jgi:hypothetical protein
LFIKKKKKKNKTKTTTQNERNVCLGHQSEQKLGSRVVMEKPRVGFVGSELVTHHTKSMVADSKKQLCDSAQQAFFFFLFHIPSSCKMLTQL